MKTVTPARPLRRLFALLALCALAGCASGPKSTNPHADQPLPRATLDLPRYMGTWYIVARIPYFLEKNFVDEKTHFTLRDNGTILENFSARKGGFDGEDKRYTFIDTPDPATGNAVWSIKLFWPFYGSQVTTYVDDAYEYTLIGYKDKSLGWIFARKPELSEAKYRELLQRFEDQGYDSSKFRRVPQRPDEIGKPGFETIEK